MSYEVVFSEKAKKEINKLDKSTATFITAWVRKNLYNCENPRLRGKGLTANRSGQWRYRIGDYRIISNISDEKTIILILTISHRREVYDKQPVKGAPLNL